MLVASPQYSVQIQRFERPPVAQISRSGPSCTRVLSAQHSDAYSDDAWRSCSSLRWDQEGMYERGFILPCVEVLALLI